MQKHLISIHIINILNASHHFWKFDQVICIACLVRGTEIAERIVFKFLLEIFIHPIRLFLDNCRLITALKAYNRRKALFLFFL